MNELIDNWPAWVTVITTVVSAAAAISAITPTKTDDKVMSSILRVVNVLGLNVGKARNADDT